MRKKKNRFVFRIPIPAIVLILLLIWNSLYSDPTEYSQTQLVPVVCQLQSVESSRGYRVSTAYIFDENGVAYHYMEQGDLAPLKAIPQGQTIRMLIEPDSTWYSQNICYDRQIAFLEVNGVTYYSLEDYSLQKKATKNSDIALYVVVCVLIGAVMIRAIFKYNPWIAQTIKKRMRKREEKARIKRIRNKNKNKQKT